MVHGKFEKAPANAEPKKKGRTDISEQRPPSIHIEGTPKEPPPTPAQEKATSPTPTLSPTPANDSLDSLMHAPSSLKLNPPPGASPLPSSSLPTATPDRSLQLTPAPSPSPSPKGRGQKSVVSGQRSQIASVPKFQLALSHSRGGGVEWKSSTLNFPAPSRQHTIATSDLYCFSRMPRTWRRVCR